MKYKFIIIFLSVLILSNCYGQEAILKNKKDEAKTLNNFSLKAGVSLANRMIEAEAGTHDRLFSYGINTQFGYLFEKLELNINAYLFMGKTEDLRYFINDINLYASGGFSSFHIAPMIKYISNFEPKKNWHFYITAGAVWSMQSHKLLNFHDQGIEKKEHRFNVSSKGQIAGFGFQEMLPNKSQKAIFVEILGHYVRAYEMTLVDSSNFKSVSKKSKNDNGLQIFDRMIMINIGISIF